MSATTPSPVSAEPSRFAIRLPHWGWFLLATVLLVVGVLGLSIWLPYHREQQVIQKIEDWGGNVLTERVGPEWLQRLMDEDEFTFFDRIVSVRLETSRVTATDLVHLNGLTHLRVLDARRTQFSDSSLAYLNNLPNLRELCLSKTVVTDAGLVHLSKMTNLQELYLDGTAVTDPVHLSGLKKLRKLDLSETRVTDEGLRHLSRLTNLRDLVLNDKVVTFEGANELKKALPDCEVRISVWTE
jgi:Leucine-rich repeat (LRR) protein